MTKIRLLKKIGMICVGILIIVGMASAIFYKLLMAPADIKVDLTAHSVETKYDNWEDITVEKLVVRVAEQIENTWSQCDRIWPRMNFGDSQVLFIVTNDQGYTDYTYLIDSQREIKQIPYKEIEVFYNKSEGSPFFKSASNKLNDIPTMSLTISEDYIEEEGIQNKGEYKALSENTIHFMIATHEEFHNRQREWKGIKKFLLDEQIENYNALSDVYLIRQARLEVIYNLRQAILQPEKEVSYLNAAKWWWDYYKTQYPDVYISARASDVLEGTARYFDMALNVRSAYGMDAKEEQIKEGYQKLVELDYEIDARTYSAKDFLGDSYPLGGFAGVLLERQEYEGWQEEVMNQGTIPVEILLREYSGEVQVPSDGIITLLDEIYS